MKPMKKFFLGILEGATAPQPPPPPQLAPLPTIQYTCSLVIYSYNCVHLKNHDISHNSFYKPAKSSDNPFSRFRQQLFISLLFTLL